MKRILLALTCCLLAALPQTALAKQQMKIAWFAELNPEHSFWKQNFLFANAVADDLGIKLVPHYVNSDQFLYKKLLNTLSQKDDDSSVDGIVFLNMKNQNKALLELVEQGDVPAISNVLTMDYDLVGKPRENYRQWIAEIFDDERSNGYRLAKRLIEEARQQNKFAADGKIHMVAINGNPVDSAGIYRMRGLQKAVNESPDVVLEQSFTATHWSAAEAKLFTTTALRRYPDVNVIWAANDDAVLGVLEGARQLGKDPKTDILTGGIDGTLQVIEKVQRGEVVCTIGGLTMHSGWAVLLLHDYLMGHDFVDDTGVLIRNKNLLIDQSNAALYLDKFGGGDWASIDFKRFSKHFSPDLLVYDFSPALFLPQQ